MIDNEYMREKRAEEIYDGLKYLLENGCHYWWVSEQKGLDLILNKTEKDLKYSTIYFYPNNYELKKIPSEYMTFLPWREQKSSFLALGEIRVPNDVTLRSLHLEGGSLRTSPRNMVLGCNVTDTYISMAHGYNGFHKGGKVGYSRYSDVDPLFYVFESCYFTDCQIDAFLGERCILDGTKRGPFFNGKDCYDSKKRIILQGARTGG